MNSAGRRELADNPVTALGSEEGGGGAPVGVGQQMGSQDFMWAGVVVPHSPPCL